MFANLHGVNLSVRSSKSLYKARRWPQFYRHLIVWLSFWKNIMLDGSGWNSPIIIRQKLQQSPVAGKNPPGRLVGRTMFWIFPQQKNLNLTQINSKLKVASLWQVKTWLPLAGGRWGGWGHHWGGNSTPQQAVGPLLQKKIENITMLNCDDGSPPAEV